MGVEELAGIIVDFCAQNGTDPASLGLRTFCDQCDDPRARSAARKGRWAAAKLLACGDEGLLPARGPSVNVLRTTTLQDAEGNIRLQWVQAKPKHDSVERYLAAMEKRVASGIQPKEPVAAPAGGLNDSLLNMLNIGDMHFGMLVRPPFGDTESEWDIQTAHTAHVRAFRYLMQNAPPARRILINQMGDAVHFDNHLATTVKGTPLGPVAGFFEEALEAAIDAQKFVLDLALSKYQEVWLSVRPGNHDKIAGFATYLVLRERYRHEVKEGRLRLGDAKLEADFWQFGKCMFMCTHGDRYAPSRPLKIQSLMSTDQPEMWGSTRYREAHFGHVHHENILEIDGCKILTHPILAPQDRWHWGEMYRSLRGMSVRTYHEDGFYCGTTNYHPRMFGGEP